MVSGHILTRGKMDGRPITIKISPAVVPIDRYNSEITLSLWLVGATADGLPVEALSGVTLLFLRQIHLIRRDL